MNYNNTIHIAFGLRDGENIYYRYVLSVMSQISLVTSGRVHIHILHDDTLRSESLGNIRHTAEILNQDLSFYDISTEKEYLDMQNGTLYRLFLPKVCSHLDRVIYLDADILVVGDLRRLWEVDLGENLLGGVLDSESTRDVVDVLSRYYHKKINKTSYFNAGILLMDLEKIREESANLPQEYLTFINEYPHALLLDQDFLNYKYQGRYKKLSNIFNFIPHDSDSVDKDLIDNQVIIHFAGLYKPWNCRNPLVLRIFFQHMLSSFPEKTQAYEISLYMSNIPYDYCKKTGLILYNNMGNKSLIKSYISSIKILLKEVYKVDSFRRFCHGVTVMKMMYLYNVHYQYFSKSR